MIQYNAYCYHAGCKPRIDTSKAAMCHFGNGSEISQYTAPISFPVSTLNITLEAHILIDAVVPLLICIDEMDKWGPYFNNITNRLIHLDSNQYISVPRDGNHPFIKWNPFKNCNYTTAELHRLHRRFGPPHTDELIQLFCKADFRRVKEDIYKILKPFHLLAMLVRLSDHDHVDLNLPFVTTPISTALFTSTFFGSTRRLCCTSLTIQPVTSLHVLFLPSAQKETLASLSLVLDWHLYRSFRRNRTWRRETLLAESFQKHADLFASHNKAIPVESANSMSIVQRYHDPVRQAYHIIKTDSPDTDDDLLLLQMAIKAVNESFGPNGISPTLAVYGPVPPLGYLHDLPSIPTYRRAIAVKKATQSFTKHFTSRQVKDALRTRNSPDVTNILSVHIGSHALVYRIQKDRWDGPFTILNIDRDGIYLLLPHGPSKFRSTLVKPYNPLLTSTSDTNTVSDNQNRSCPNNTNVNAQFPSRSMIHLLQIDNAVSEPLIFANHLLNGKTTKNMASLVTRKVLNSSKAAYFLLFHTQNPTAVAYTKFGSAIIWKTKDFPQHLRNPAFCYGLQWFQPWPYYTHTYRATIIPTSSALLCRLRQWSFSFLPGHYSGLPTTKNKTYTSDFRWASISPASPKQPHHLPGAPIVRCPRSRCTLVQHLSWPSHIPSTDDSCYTRLLPSIYSKCFSNTVSSSSLLSITCL